MFTLHSRIVILSSDIKIASLLIHHPQQLIKKKYIECSDTEIRVSMILLPSYCKLMKAVETWEVDKPVSHTEQ